MSVAEDMNVISAAEIQRLHVDPFMDGSRWAQETTLQAYDLARDVCRDAAGSRGPRPI